jgi:hypothetical protein
MPENDPGITGRSSAGSMKISGRSPDGYRAALTRSPAARLDGRSPTGKRIRDLYESLMARLNQPADVMVQADILALVELKAMSETARLRILEGKDQNTNGLVRLENLVRRAEARVGLEIGAATKREPETLEEYLARTSITDDGEIDDLADNEETP